MGAAAVPRRRPSATRWSRGCSETWEHAGRWPGPADDPDFRAAVEQGMLRHDAAQQRERVRAWLVDLLGAEGVPIALDEPTDWSRWDPELRRYEP